MAQYRDAYEQGVGRGEMSVAKPLPQQGFQEPSDDDEAIAQAHSDEPVYIYDTQGKCRWVNRSGESLLGVDASQIIGRYIFELFPGQVLHLPSNLKHSAIAAEDSVVLDVFSPPADKMGIDR